MKKIIIFDEIEDRLIELSKELAFERKEEILFKKDWDEYFVFSSETGFIEIIDKKFFDDVALIIIHQSHSDPKFPESAVTEIKDITAGLVELYVYSGYKTTNMKDKTLSRISFNSYLGDFIKCYQLTETLCFEIFFGNNKFTREVLIKDAQITLEENDNDFSCFKTSSSFIALMFFCKRNFISEIDYYSSRPVDEFYNFLNTLF